MRVASATPTSRLELLFTRSQVPELESLARTLRPARSNVLLYTNRSSRTVRRATSSTDILSWSRGVTGVDRRVREPGSVAWEESMSEQGEPDQVSGLVKAAFTNNRGRGASATPVPDREQPLQPLRTTPEEFQKHLDAMNRGGSRNVSLGSFNGFGPSDNSRPSHTHGHGRGMGSASTNLSGNSIGSGAPLAQALSGLQINETSLTMLDSLVWEYISSHDRAVHHNPNMAPSEQARFLERSGLFRRDYAAVTRRLQRQLEEKDGAAAATRSQLQDLLKKCDDLMRERDDSIQRETIALTQSQAHQTAEKNIRIENQRLTQQVAVLQASTRINFPQRAALPENTSPFAPRNSDPFVSPREYRITTHAGDIPPSILNPNILALPPNATTPLKPTTQAPSTHPPLMEIPTEPASLRNRHQHIQHSTATTGQAGPSNNSNMAMVLKPTPESHIFAEEFDLLYRLVERYVNDYCSQPNPEVDQTIPPTKQHLWAYMMDLTYPNQTQDAHNHTKLLIEAKESRSFFVMRLILNYLFEEMLTVKTWLGFSLETDQTFKNIKESLGQRGLSNEFRQQHIDREVAAVEQIIGADNFDHWAKVTKDHHCARLRDYLGMLLNKGIHRVDAGNELGKIVLHAWSLNLKMRLSHLTFQVIFPPTAGKFLSATMIARDRTDVTPMQLQISQTRLKLVITPVVTLRDDRGPSIKVRNLHHAQVLTMP
ncbi:hypothetical protein HYFRA_00003856 [Hymenoscyphus fraxineus]|uniref:Uncharacterized protein n=1 Tax=Hymenoscyphus fraxineus TaxID=746836 RepID=A0A9N9KYR9_9HELO|nr:hypothetical protein HYFRA_00003856 [Hymenoscyphus fraxineus]